MVCLETQCDENIRLAENDFLRFCLFTIWYLLDNDVSKSEFNIILLYYIVYKRKQKRREHDVQE